MRWPALFWAAAAGSAVAAPKPVAFLHTIDGGSAAMDYVFLTYAHANNLTAVACRTWRGAPEDAAPREDVVTAVADERFRRWSDSRLLGGGGAAVLRDLSESYKAAFGARRLVAAVFHHPLDLALASYLGSCAFGGGGDVPRRRRRRATAVAPGGDCGFYDFERRANATTYAAQWTATLGASTQIPSVDDDESESDDAADRVEMTLNFLDAEVDLVGSADLLPLTMVVWGLDLGAAAPLRYRRKGRAREAATAWLRLNEHPFEYKRAELDRATARHPDVLLFHAASRLLRRRAAVHGITHRDVAAYHAALVRRVDAPRGGEGGASAPESDDAASCALPGGGGR